MLRRTRFVAGDARHAVRSVPPASRANAGTRNSIRAPDRRWSRGRAPSARPADGRSACRARLSSISFCSAFAPGRLQQLLEILAVAPGFQLPHRHGAAGMQIIGAVEAQIVEQHAVELHFHRRPPPAPKGRSSGRSMRTGNASPGATSRLGTETDPLPPGVTSCASTASVIAANSPLAGIAQGERRVHVHQITRRREEWRSFRPNRRKPA